jgi:hypothetical protein
MSTEREQLLADIQALQERQELLELRAKAAELSKACDVIEQKHGIPKAAPKPEPRPAATSPEMAVHYAEQDLARKFGIDPSDKRALSQAINSSFAGTGE